MRISVIVGLCLVASLVAAVEPAPLPEIRPPLPGEIQGLWRVDIDQMVAAGGEEAADPVVISLLAEMRVTISAETIDIQIGEMLRDIRDYEYALPDDGSPHAILITTIPGDATNDESSAAPEPGIIHAQWVDSVLRLTSASDGQVLHMVRISQRDQPTPPVPDAVAESESESESESERESEPAP